MEELYKKRLSNLGYSEEEIRIAENTIATLEHCTFEQFKELVKSSVVIRTRKLKKPRNLYVTEEGRFLYLDHYYKRYNYCGYFKDDI